MKNPFDTKPEKYEKSEETQKPVQAEEKKESNRESNKTIVLSEESAYIQEIVDTQPKTLHEIEVMDRKPLEGFHRLSLPSEIDKYTPKFTFRWLFNRRRSISEATQIKGWFLVNRAYFPDLPNHLFTANGSIERGDNILAFIPKKLAEDMRKEPIEKSKDMVDSRIGAHKGNPNFYVPSDKSEEGESSRVVGL